MSTRARRRSLVLVALLAAGVAAMPGSAQTPLPGCGPGAEPRAIDIDVVDRSAESQTISSTVSTAFDAGGNVDPAGLPGLVATHTYEVSTSIAEAANVVTSAPASVKPTYGTTGRSTVGVTPPRGGPITFTVTYDDQRRGCAASGAYVLTADPPTAAPRVVVRHLVDDFNASGSIPFVVGTTATGDLRPITVRARLLRGRRIPRAPLTKIAVINLAQGTRQALVVSRRKLSAGRIALTAGDATPTGGPKLAGAPLQGPFTFELDGRVGLPTRVRLGERRLYGEASLIVEMVQGTTVIHRLTTRIRCGVAIRKGDEGPTCVYPRFKARGLG